LYDYIHEIKANKSVFSLVNTAVNMTLPAFAEERRAAAPCCGAVAAVPYALSIDISCPHGAQQQTRRTPLLLSIDGTDRRTDGRTLDCFINPAPILCGQCR